jgi:hypothetical protein
VRHDGELEPVGAGRGRTALELLQQPAPEAAPGVRGTDSDDDVGGVAVAAKDAPLRLGVPDELALLLGDDGDPARIGEAIALGEAVDFLNGIGMDKVYAHEQHLLGYFAATFGERATCRASTHPAGYTGETRVYLTVSRKEVPPG